MGKREFLEAFGFLLGQELQKAAPKKTGRLAKSFPGTMSVEEDTIHYMLPFYAEFLEYGTLPHKITAKNKKALKFKDPSGDNVIVKSVNHPGTRPTFFMRDTIHRKTEEVLKRTLDIINK